MEFALAIIPVEVMDIITKYLQLAGYFFRPVEGGFTFRGSSPLKRSKLLPGGFWGVAMWTCVYMTVLAKIS